MYDHLMFNDFYFERWLFDNRNFHILMMYSNYAINISVTIGSMIPSSTNTLQFIRDGSRAAATSKMERFVIIFNGWKQP